MAFIGALVAGVLDIANLLSAMTGYTEHNMVQETRSGH